MGCNKQEETFQIEDLIVVSSGHRVNLKQSKNIDMYLDPARKLYKVTVIPLIIRVLGIVQNNLRKKKAGRTGNPEKSQNHLDNSIAERS